MEQLKDLHYVQLPSQGNIYTLTGLEVANSPFNILVASLKRDIFCIEFQESPVGLIPMAKEVSFTYIPSGAEIISMDAFNKSSTKNEFVIGITIIKNSNNLDSLEFYLNIYSEWEDSDDFNIENIAQNCLNVELNFTPYQLTHSNLIIWEDDIIVSEEVVFLLAGSDNQIHIYREYTTDHLYKEVETKEYFPEFAKTPSPVVWIDIHLNDDHSERIAAVACECGYVRLTKVDLKTRKLVFNFSTKFQNYISNVKIYTQNSRAPKLDLLQNISKEKEEAKSILNLIVVNTILPPVLFEDILTFGLSKYFSLPRHDYTCVFSCCQIVDIDFDGKKEILIGNSAEEVVMYKHDEGKGWFLEEIKLFASPVISIHCVDVLGDGVEELVILLMKGLVSMIQQSKSLKNVILNSNNNLFMDDNFQHDFNAVQKALNNKIDNLILPNISNLNLNK